MFECSLGPNVSVIACGEATVADLMAEGLIPLAEAARHCPRSRPGRKVANSTIARWARRGKGGIRLESVQTPAGLCTTVPAIARFFARLTAAAGVPTPAPRRPHQDEHNRAVEAELARRFRI
jgi:hypothetical protein